MAELAILLGTLLTGLVIALLDRAADRRAKVVGSSGHRDRVRAAIDRMRMRKPAAGGPAGGAEDGPRGGRPGSLGGV